MPFRIYSRSQAWLFPPSLEEFLPPDHAARFVAAMVDELDLGALGICAVPDDLGAPAYCPDMLLACWLYGFMTRLRSSRKLERACRENVPFMWLTGMQQPDHVTLWRFYRNNRKAMGKLFKRTVKLAVQVGLIDFALQAIDGSKMPVASADSLKDMKALNKLLQEVEAEIAALEKENRQGQKKQRCSQRPWAKKEELRERIHKAMKQLEPEAEGDDADSPSKTGQKPKKKKLASVTDPDARIMKGRHGLGVSYNAQAVVDAKNQIIVAADVVNEQADNNQLIPLLDEAEDNTGQMADTALGDAGYFSGENLRQAKGRTNLLVPDPQLRRKELHPDKWPYHKDHFRYDSTEDVYICPEGKKLIYSRTTTSTTRDRHPLRVYRCHDCAGCPVRDQCTRAARGRTIKISGYEPLIRAHRGKMKTDEARKLMRQRAGIVESVFGIIKEQMDARRFLLRGLANVQAEWHLLCAAFNLRKLYKYWWLKRPECALNPA